MADRHKIKPMSLRLPEALSAWLAAEAQRTGRPVRRIILDTLERERHAGEQPADPEQEG